MSLLSQLNIIGHLAPDQLTETKPAIRGSMALPWIHSADSVVLPGMLTLAITNLLHFGFGDSVLAFLLTQFLLLDLRGLFISGDTKRDRMIRNAKALQCTSPPSPSLFDLESPLDVARLSRVNSDNRYVDTTQSASKS